MTNSTTSDHAKQTTAPTIVLIPMLLYPLLCYSTAATVLAAIWFFTSLSIPELSLLAIVIPAAITLVSMITSAVLLGPISNYTYLQTIDLYGLFIFFQTIDPLRAIHLLLTIHPTGYSSSFNYPSYRGYVSTSYQYILLIAV